MESLTEAATAGLLASPSAGRHHHRSKSRHCNKEELFSAVDLRRPSAGRDPRLVECELLVLQDRLQETERERDSLATRVHELESERDKLAEEVSRLRAAAEASAATATAMAAQAALSSPRVMSRSERSSSDSFIAVDEKEGKEKEKGRKRRLSFWASTKEGKDKGGSPPPTVRTTVSLNAAPVTVAPHATSQSFFLPSVAVVTALATEQLEIPPPPVPPPEDEEAVLSAAQQRTIMDGSKTMPVISSDRRAPLPSEWSAPPAAAKDDAEAVEPPLPPPPAEDVTATAPDVGPPPTSPPATSEKDVVEALLRTAEQFLESSAERWSAVEVTDLEPGDPVFAMIEKLSKVWRAMGEAPLPQGLTWPGVHPPPRPDADPKLERLRARVSQCLWECRAKIVEMHAALDENRSTALVQRVANAVTAVLSSAATGPPPAYSTTHPAPKVVVSPAR